MKKNLLLLTLLLFSLHGRCDTLDFWHVYVNDLLVAQLNSNSQDFNVYLKKSSVKPGDSLSVFYGSDHPCIGCPHGLYTLLEVKESTPETITTVGSQTLTIPLYPLLELANKYQLHSVSIHYYEQDQRGMNGRKIFILNFT